MAERIPPTKEEVIALIKASPPASVEELEQALNSLENVTGSEDEVFMLARSLSKRTPKYKVRLGAFFDPTDHRGKGSVVPNIKFAYDEYKDSGAIDSQGHIDRLIAWSKTAEAEGVEGLDEFNAAIN
jgi:hypothetical protein